MLCLFLHSASFNAGLRWNQEGVTHGILSVDPELNLVMIIGNPTVAVKDTAQLVVMMLHRHQRE